MTFFAFVLTQFFGKHAEAIGLLRECIDAKVTQPGVTHQGDVWPLRLRAAKLQAQERVHRVHLVPQLLLLVPQRCGKNPL